MVKASLKAVNNRGFTLIEIIVALVLVAIIVAVAGLGLVKASQGFVFGQKNAQTIQTAQIALARIVTELGSANVTGINAVTANSVDYETSYGSGAVNSTIMFSGSSVQINGNTLINVTASGLTCYDGGANPTLAAANVRRVDFTFTVNGADNTAAAFNGSICVLESY